VVDGVLEDVVDRVVVLVLRLDHPRPEPLPEDVVLATVPLVERASVLAVQVTHAVGEVRQRRLDEKVVVVPEQATGMEAPAIVALDPTQNLEEDPAVLVVLEDRSVVVALRPDVVVGAGREETMRTSHSVDGNDGREPPTAWAMSWHRPGTDPLRARQVTGLREACRLERRTWLLRTRCP
jgi:hypothetical protein